MRRRIGAGEDPSCLALLLGLAWLSTFPNGMRPMTFTRTTVIPPGTLSLDDQGIQGVGRQHWNASQSVLAEQALARGEGSLSDQGALVFATGKYTGRSPRDKFIVREPSSAAEIDWGEVNQPFEPEAFDALYDRVRDHLRGREVWVQDVFAGTDPLHRLPIRVVCERAYPALFSRQLFVRPTREELAAHRPEFTVIAVPDFQAEPARDRTRSEVFILLNLARRLILIGGTQYAGEIKKSIFSLLNYLLPLRGVLSMHCSANVGEEGDVALFFGLSGTGKTTLSADPVRRLIGDDEHGWSDDGVFNFEGGCYAKCIRLDRLNEPEIYEAIRFGTVLENVVLDLETRVPDFADASLTENTRAAYPIDYIPNHVPGGRGGHPRQIIFLTCDAFGVFPPLSRLTPEQAMYHFLSGYTAKVAGTERGLGNEPSAVFSTCFGAPFMTLPPGRYADLLGARMRRHQVDAWLLNTGWTGGGYGAGRRIALPHTRALVDAVMSGTLRDATFVVDPIFGLGSPRACPGVPATILDPRAAWSDPAAYDDQATRLARRFHENFTRFTHVDPRIQAAGPRAGSRSIEA
jgi:phosphoenolpyruvate carboxykinase (ATP)